MDKEFLDQYWDKYRTSEHNALKRSRQYNYKQALAKRDWAEILVLPDPSAQEWAELPKLHKEFLVGCNNPEGPAVKELHLLRTRLPDKTKPVMVIEYGFGHTTYVLLDWCIKNNGYLVTVDMPIAKPKVDKDHMKLLFHWGVDRYWKKYKHCVTLANHAVSHKRWFWLNEDIFTVTKQLQDEKFRNSLFLNGKIDFFWEDAIHDDKFLADLYNQVRPFINKGGIFTGDDNCPTFFID